MEELQLIIELNIKNKIQAEAVEGVAHILKATACINEDDAETIIAIVSDSPFLV